MNGAEALVRTLIDGGVEVCFANPGTSEMHLVAALDRVPGMRCALGLFEGVVTGAADGYGRMTGKPAATLLHLGPGLANGSANLHNARKARTPIVNLVGDHATYHLANNAPLTSDVETVAAPFADWVRRAGTADDLARFGAEALAAAGRFPGHVATLIVAADAAWNEARGPSPLARAPAPRPVDPDTLEAAARLLRSGEPVLLLVGGRALTGHGLERAGAIADATGCTLMAPTSNARMERGAGRVPIRQVPYATDEAVAALDGLRHCILVEATAPVAFFAHPGQPTHLLPEACDTLVLAGPEQDGRSALDHLAEALGARPNDPRVAPLDLPSRPRGALTPASIAQAVAASLPEQGIVIDEGLTAGRPAAGATATARPHDWLAIVGGSIGIGPPLAAGAALACPERKVLALQADGSAMYTPQGLWTQAREGLDVTTVILSNRSYAILKGEADRVGAARTGGNAAAMLSLENPAIDWPSLAKGMGVPAERVEDAEALALALERGLSGAGPFLIEALVPD